MSTSPAKDTSKPLDSSDSKSATSPSKPEYTAEDIQRQNDEIEQERRQRPLVGHKEPSFDTLFEELKSNHSFARKLPGLSTKYSHLRRVRGDGSCFYRGFLFRLVEEMVLANIEKESAKSGQKNAKLQNFVDSRDKLYEQIKEKFEATPKYLEEVGYESNNIEFFTDTALEFIGTGLPKTITKMNEFFADPQDSMCIVWFLRLLTAGFIKHDWERFRWFVEQTYIDADDYCAKEVEPTEVECGEIQINALCDYLGVRICVQYLDANPNSDDTTEYFFGPEGQPTLLHLLYRPGHYDIIYPRV